MRFNLLVIQHFLFQKYQNGQNTKFSMAEREYDIG
jgi:hypothetical protein